MSLGITIEDLNNIVEWLPPTPVDVTTTLLDVEDIDGFTVYIFQFWFDGDNLMWNGRLHQATANGLIKSTHGDGIDIGDLIDHLKSRLPYIEFGYLKE